MNNHFIELWHKLENENQQGIVKIAYSESSPYRIYATMSSPDHVCGIAFSFNSSINIELKPFQDLCQLSVQLLSDTSFRDSSLLLVQLLNNENREVFATLCENLINATINAAAEQIMVEMVISKLCEWKALFDKLSHGPLSKVQQEGLFGELYFLKKMLLQDSESRKYDIVTTWQGMEKEHAVRDFQGKNWVVEVKTTATNRPQKVTINGERQLDDTLVENLFLFSCSIDISNAGGITLPDIISEVRGLLSSSFIARAAFDEKLYHTGYIDKDIEHYNDNHYLIRSEAFYNVVDDFPRIREDELRPGVGEVRYSIVLAACGKFVVSDLYAFSILNIK